MKITIFLLTIVLLCHYTYGEPQSYSFSNYLPKVEKTTDALVVQITPPPAKNDFYIYYRTDGLKKYQVRKMKAGSDGNLYYRLPTHNLYGKDLEYYIVEGGDAKHKTLSPVFTVQGFTRAESPDIYFQNDDAGGSASTPREPIINIEAGVDTSFQLRDTSDAPGKKFDANGTLTLSKSIVKEKFQLDFNSQFAYTHEPGEGEEKVNLTSMSVKLVSGIHTIHAGDISINDTEFTNAGLSMRGLSYTIDGKRLYLSSYITNSQQVTGFDGFGIPPGDAFYFGTTAGFNLGETLKVRGAYITGKDDQNSKTLIASDEGYREGNMYSIWANVNLFQSRLSLNGEFSRTDYGAAEDKNSVIKESDTAWRAGAAVNYGIFSASGDYKSIGEHFNPIAVSMFNNDWEGLSANTGIMAGAFTLNAEFSDKTTNLHSKVQEALRTKRLGVNLSWLAANHIKLGARLSLSNEDYDQSTGLQTGSEDMKTTEYGATLGYVFGANSITAEVGKIESNEFTTDINGKFSLDLTFGTFWVFRPYVYYQKTTSIYDNTETKTYTAYVDTTFNLIQEMLALNIQGNMTRTDNDNMETTVLSIDGDLTLELAKLFKQKLSPSLSLKGKYERNKNDIETLSFTTLYLQANLSF